MKIAYLDFVYNENALFPDFIDELKKHAPDGYIIDYHYVTGINNLEYMAYEAWIMPKILEKIRDLKQQGYEAVIAALRLAEMEYSCKAYSSWTYSRKRAYEMPPKDEVEKFFNWQEIKHEGIF